VILEEETSKCVIEALNGAILAIANLSNSHDLRLSWDLL
jgi:hypothetical protein